MRYMKNNRSLIDREYISYTDNEGYIISIMFCNPLAIKKDINRLYQ